MFYGAFGRNDGAGVCGCTWCYSSGWVFRVVGYFVYVCGHSRMDVSFFLNYFVLVTMYVPVGELQRSLRVRVQVNILGQKSPVNSAGGE